MALEKKSVAFRGDLIVAKRNNLVYKNPFCNKKGQGCAL
jgi:hypothetical protein